MKQKIAILTDSSSSIYRVNHDYDNIFMIDLPCIIGDEIYTDFMKNKDEPFYQALGKTDLVPKTSQPSISETMEKFEYIKSLGFSHIIYLPISKELSGTYLNGHASKDSVEGIEVEIVDTKTTASILCAMAVEAARLAKDGFLVKEIIQKILAMRKRSVYYVTVNDLTFLVRNGRLSNAKSIIAKIFRIKPVIILNDEGKLVSIAPVRTYVGAIRELVNKVAKEFNPDTGVLHISYTGITEDLKYIKSLIDEALPNSKIEIYTIPSTILAHLGLTAIALGYIHY
ncbi:MAG: DegV family protein [Bacilli bacterium]|nr:DegV family protein [Bacilli bacterium]